MRRRKNVVKPFRIYVAEGSNAPVRTGRACATLDQACNLARSFVDSPCVEVRDESIPFPRSKIVALYTHGLEFFRFGSEPVLPVRLTVADPEPEVTLERPMGLQAKLAEHLAKVVDNPPPPVAPQPQPRPQRPIITLRRGKAEAKVEGNGKRVIKAIPIPTPVSNPAPSAKKSPSQAALLLLAKRINGRYHVA